MMDDGTPLYDRKLSHDEVRHRIAACWVPYHDHLKATLDAAHARFGKVWHINCHSMPAVAAQFATDKPGMVHPDFVLGDRDGATAGPEFHTFVADWLRARGYNVAVNDPYKGVEIVRRYGQPSQGRHSLQIEVNRKLYMDEALLRPSAGYDKLRADFGALTAALVEWTRAQWRDPRHRTQASHTPIACTRRHSPPAAHITIPAMNTPPSRDSLSTVQAAVLAHLDSARLWRASRHCQPSPNPTALDTARLHTAA